jgi:hypothetical protein
MVYSGAIPMPDHEEVQCKSCTEKHGPLEGQGNIKPEYAAGVFRAADQQSGAQHE